MHGSFPQGESDRNDYEDDKRRRSTGVIALVIVALLVGGGYFLIVKLRAMARIQDCVMSGRTNCAPIDLGR